MKALPFKISYGDKSSMQVVHERLDNFYPHYHLHEEVQLTLIIQGAGIAYIGDQLIDFVQGNIFLIGRQLPHVFRNEMNRAPGVEAISIFFLKDFLGRSFFQLPEIRVISRLLEDSTRGLRLAPKTAEKITPVMHSISTTQGFEQLMLLLKGLHIIALGQKEYITGPDYQRPRRQIDGKKINDVFNYLSANYASNLSLKEVADVAHMSPTAFCRYFKRHTRKSYSRFLNEIRVNQACKLLQENNEPISQIAYFTGYNNISNFNRQFKKITGKTPSEYQEINL